MAKGTQLIQAADTLNRLALQYEGMVAAAAVVSGIGSLENHLEELAAQRDLSLAELTSCHAQGETDRAEHQRLKKQYQDERAQWTAEAARMKQEAGDEVAKTFAAARDAIASAQEQETAARTARQTSEQATTVAAQQEVATLHLVRDQLVRDLSTLEADISAAKTKHEDILAMIRAMTEPNVQPGA